MTMGRVNQVKQTPLLYTYTRGIFSQSSDSIGVDRGRPVNLINPREESDLAASSLGPPKGPGAAGVTDRDVSGYAENFNHVRREDATQRN